MDNGIFYVTSPLQILCAIEAEHYFKITKPRYILIIDKKSLCGRQMLKIAEDEHLPFSIVNKDNFNRNKLKSFITLLLFFISRIRLFSYKYVFLGDENENQITLYSVLSLRRKGYFIYLDDGISSVKFLTEGVSQPSILRIFYNVLKKTLSFEDKLYFTHYFSRESHIYRIIPNKFEFLRKKIKQNKRKEIAYILGTPVEERLKKSRWMSPNNYQRVVESIFKTIKCQGIKKIVYAPHRRENLDLIKDLCWSYGVECEYLDLPIEAYLLTNNIKPKCVWGFESSALYTLKILYPDVPINNVYFDYNINDILNEFYQLIGVKNWNSKKLNSLE